MGTCDCSRTAVMLHINLKFEQHNPFLGLIELWERGELCDVNIVLGDQVFKAHSVVLALRSEFFKKKLTEIQGVEKLIQVQGINHQIFANLLRFVYHGNLQISDDDIVELLSANKEFQFQGLQEAVTTALANNPSTVSKLTEDMHALSMNRKDEEEEDTLTDQQLEILQELLKPQQLPPPPPTSLRQHTHATRGLQYTAQRLSSQETAFGRVLHVIEQYFNQDPLLLPPPPESPPKPNLKVAKMIRKRALTQYRKLKLKPAPTLPLPKTEDDV
eukprot:c6786_g1_i2.p1 GENE.c6786_g1_i2~~c6786_g1_i2.p1  ORF type:complete len:273 (+),score=60.47 c6786_g1_i2:1-819(+)